MSKILDFIITTYFKISSYLYFGNFRKKHITFGLVNGKFQITSIDHEDFIKAVQKKLDKLSQKNNRKKFIQLALTESLQGCNFIIISDPNNENKFVQFWTGDHRLKFNFYANKCNKLKKYFLTVVGLLSEMGFVNDNTPEYRGSMTYKVDKGKDYLSLDANFRQDLNLAAEFIELIFKQIYKTKGNKLVVKVE